MFPSLFIASLFTEHLTLESFFLIISITKDRIHYSLFHNSDSRDDTPNTNLLIAYFLSWQKNLLSSLNSSSPLWFDMSHWLQILFAVLQYWIVSITTVFLNKYRNWVIPPCYTFVFRILLSTIDVTSSLPLTTTWVQTLLSALLFSIIHVSTYLWNHSFSLFPFKRRIHYDKIQASPEMPPTDERVSSSSLDSWKQKLNSFLTGAITLFPLSVAFLLMLLFTNLCLREVHITYYQIARSLGLPMIPLLSYETWTRPSSIHSFILFKEKTHWSIVLSCLLIVSGYRPPQCLIH